MKGKNIPKKSYSILPTAIYYSVCLVILFLYQFTEFIAQDYQTFIGVDLILTLYTSVFVGFYWATIKKLLKTPLHWKPLLSIIVIAVTLGSIIHYLPSQFNENKHNQYQISLIFWLSEYPKFYSILFLCVLPAIFEEFAFRGFVLENLLGHFPTNFALLLSAILFAGLHLSLISVIWLIPIGFIFAYFRYHYQSLWYSIIGHFCYNLTIILFEFSSGWV